MEQRDIDYHQIHVNILHTVGELNCLKPSYNGQVNTNLAEKETLLTTLYSIERDTKKKRLYLKEKEIELEDLQHLTETERKILDEHKKQFELLKSIKAKKDSIGDTADDH
ncbi:CG8090-PA, putative [Brugia malayi]|nr:CG8090-PA, putative [Brugia malayi]CRZ25472.1 Bm14795, isoform b [Brugia malayi]VIO99696.1 CG8090-PA, putative [Brugia malayi]